MINMFQFRYKWIICQSITNIQKLIIIELGSGNIFMKYLIINLENYSHIVEIYFFVFVFMKYWKRHRSYVFPHRIRIKSNVIVFFFFWLSHSRANAICIIIKKKKNIVHIRVGVDIWQSNICSNEYWIDEQMLGCEVQWR